MAKKVNSLADDFAGINKAADSNVLSILSEEKQNKSREKGADQPGKPDKQVTAASNDTSQAAKSESTHHRKPTKARQPRKLEDWGKPVAHFNTRIPEQMSELLDDLIYRLRKKGRPKTKQQLAHEAIHDLLRKHSVC